jgi:hypothetical protein
MTANTVWPEIIFNKLVLAACLLLAASLPAEDHFIPATFIAGSMISIADTKATSKLIPEIERLNKLKPLGRRVEIAVLRRDLAGFLLLRDLNVMDRIFIIDRGHTENVKTLRHEWDHAFNSHKPFFTAEATASATKAESE